LFATLPELVDGLREADEGHGLSLVDVGGGTVDATWSALHARALERAGELQARGVGRGDPVLACITNEGPVLETFLALLYLGAVPVSVGGPTAGQDPAVRAALVERIGAAAQARWALDQRELASATVERIPLVEPARRAGPCAPPVRATVRPDDLALVQYSSGSTSRPKGIRLTHRNLAENVRLVVEAGRRHAGEALATWLPLCHDMGLVGTFLATLDVRPRRLVLMHPMRFLLRPIHWLEALSRTGARVSACPNFGLDVCVDRVRPGQLVERSIDLGALELLMVGAETVRPDSLRAFSDRFAPWGLRPNVLQPVYGLAEATLIVTAPPEGEAWRTRRIEGHEVVSVGLPLGDFEVRILTKAGREAAVLETGEILLRGCCVTPGIVGAESEEDAFLDGWLRTGDLGARDEDGRIYVTGRIKDLIVVDGRNHYAHDVCAALQDLPFIRASGVHAFATRADGRRRVVVLAAARPGHGAEDLRVDLVKRRVLARCGLAVDDVLFVPRIPRTSSGKVARRACADLYQVRRGA
jgi:fatty-acyl-CoA synthase